MAKKQKIWFSHDADAWDDEKIIALTTQYDMAGYGRWWRLVEILRKQEGYKYDVTSKFAYAALAKHLKCTQSEVKEFIMSCIEEFSLLQSDEQFIWSESLIERMEPMDKKREKLSENGKRGAAVTNGKKSANISSSSANEENEAANADKKSAILNNIRVNNTKGDKNIEEATLLSQNKILRDAEADRQKGLKVAYGNISKDPVSIYNFIKSNKPAFIEPYIAMWNHWAIKYGKPQVLSSTPKRVDKLKVRLKEEEFDFLLILEKGAHSPYLLKPNNWFNFDWLIKNSDNYIKLLEGSYAKEEEKQEDRNEKPEQYDLATEHLLNAIKSRTQT